MKVSELIELLSDMDQDANVHFCYDYNDYWRTTVAPEVGQVFEADITYSEYHRMPKLVEDASRYADNWDADATLNNVVVIG